jgi:hypothetical protein
MRPRNGVTVAPSRRMALPDDGAGDSRHSRPFSRALRDAVVREHCCVAAIPRLLDRRGPSAVEGFVMPAWVNTVQCAAFGSLAHVGQEVHERLLPTFADRNSTTTVPSVLPVRERRAARDHRTIRNVGRARSAVQSVMPVSRKRIDLETPTRLRVAALQHVGAHLQHDSAIAPTRPVRFAIDAAHVRQHYQTRESLSCNVD